MHLAVISIGSNCGEKRSKVEAALKWIEVSDKMKLRASSHIYETPEIHGREITYMNAVASLYTVLDLDQLIALFKNYELNAGRDEACRKSERVPIDLDVVIWDNEVIRPKDFESSFFKMGIAELL